jgi:hypothetical protein
LGGVQNFFFSIRTNLCKRYTPFQFLKMSTVEKETLSGVIGTNEQKTFYSRSGQIYVNERDKHIPKQPVVVERA